MRKTTIANILLTILLASNVVCGQDYVELFNINYKLSPNNSYKTTNGNVDVENISSSVRLPLARDNGDFWLPGLSVNQLNFNSSLPNTAVPNTYYFTRLEFGYQKVWSDYLKMILIFMPRVSSDFLQVDDRSYQFGGVILFNKKTTDKFAWKLGFYANTEFFGIFTTPLIGFDWKASEKIRMFGAIPASMTIAYEVGKRYQTGVKYISTSTSYRVTEMATPDYIHQLTNQLSWFNDVYLTKSIVFQGQVGVSAFRYYRYFQNNDNIPFSVSAFSIGGNREPVYGGIFEDFGDGLILQAGLIYRYSLLEKKN